MHIRRAPARATMVVRVRGAVRVVSSRAAVVAPVTARAAVRRVATAVAVAMGRVVTVLARVVRAIRAVRAADVWPPAVR